MESAVYCTADLFAGDILQPQYRFLDTDYTLCQSCYSTIDKSLLTISNTPIAPFRCRSKDLSEVGIVAISVQSGTDALLSEGSEEYLRMKRKLYRDLISQQSQLSVNNSAVNSLFPRRLSSGISTALGFEDRNAQSIVRDHIDFECVFKYLCEEQEKQAVERKRQSMEELSIIALMRWFKCDFFKWCNKPACDNLDCDGRPHDMEPEGMGTPSAVEEREGGASRVELYRCKLCRRVTRFPRYNNPSYMMKHSRRGRCGEFANVFGMILRSLGFDVRYILDFTDHVWVEVWIEALQRFVHCDPCERALDSPLAYEAGWKKKLTHVLSCSRYGVDDAISRYSRLLEEVIPRRNAEYVEAISQREIQIKDIELQSRFSILSVPRGSVEFFKLEFPSSLFERFQYGKSSFENLPELPLDLMELRRQANKTDLESLLFLRTGALSPAELQGRTSGDLAWRQQRGEVKPEDIAAETCAVDENALCTTGQDRSESMIIQNLWSQAKATGKFQWLFPSHGLILSDSNANELKFELPFEAQMNNQRLKKPATSYSTTVTIQGINFPVRREGIQLFFIANDRNALYSEDGNLDSNILPSLFDTSESYGQFKSSIIAAEGGLLLVCIDSRQPISTYAAINEQLQSFFHCPEGALSSIHNEHKVYIVASLSVTHGIAVVPGTAHILPRRSVTSHRPQVGNDATFLPACMVKLWVHRRHRNGGAATAGTPSATAAEQPILPTLPLAEHFVFCENQLCTHIRHVLSATEGESLTSLAGRAMSALLEQPLSRDYISTPVHGFSIVVDPLSHLPQSALFFGIDGINSMRASKGTQTWLRIGEKNHTTSYWDTSSVVIDSYCDIGGGNHGDTMYFDGTDTITSSVWRLQRVSLWAGTSLANGVQCEYTCTDGVGESAVNRLVTPVFTSTEGSPQKYTIDLPENDTKNISTISVQAGALIDGMTVSAANETHVSVGGHGGEQILVTFGEGQSLIGFFGGYGGHLHNIGVVVRQTVGPREAIPNHPVSDERHLVSEQLPYDRLHAVYQRHGFFDTVKYLNEYQYENLHVSHFHHNNLPRLTKILQGLFTRNSPSTVKTMLQTYIAYLKNIHKNPLEEKYQTMKLKNAVVGKILAANGALDLVGFGPAAFALTADGCSLQSRWKKIIDRLPAQLSRKDMIRWLQRYIDFLTDLAAVIT